MNFKIIGTLDLLPKVAVSSIEIDGDPIAFWWNTYLVKSDMDRMLDSLPKDFTVVDNLDAAGEWFIVKDISVKGITVINKGYTPCVSSMAEVTPAKSGSYTYICKSKIRKDLMVKLQVLTSVSREVYLLTSIYPSLEVCDYMFKEENNNNNNNNNKK